MLPLHEQRIKLKSAGRHPLLAADGMPKSIQSMHRYAFKGVLVITPDGRARVKLETERSPCGAWVTSPEAIQRFVEAINSPSPTAPATKPKPAPRQHSRECAAALLDAVGI